MRIDLLHQHDEIRGLIARVRAEIVRVQNDRVPLAELRASLRALDCALTEHNEREERFLGSVLWGRGNGPLRIALMSDRHRREHDHIQHALAQAALMRDTVAGIAIVQRLLGEILEHMQDEEQALFVGISESAA